MQRLQLLEIEDQPWCPAFLRDALTDYLQHVLKLAQPYRPMAEPLAQALCHSGAERIIDLGSGAGGPWLQLEQTLAEQGVNIPILLTDRYPNTRAISKFKVQGKGIDYFPDPVDATQVPSTLLGFRTLFSSFHHFPPEQASAILEDAVRKRQGIAIFELTQRKTGPIITMLLVPLFVWLMTPFIRPLRLSRLFFTYLIPLIPLVAFFDGFVSCLRTYTPAEMKKMTAAFQNQGYLWQTGEERLKGAPGVVTYLIGYPAEQAANGQGQSERTSV